jgi:hypothetical protein
MNARRLARIWKEGKRWHWSLILAGPGDASHARVYQGTASSWRYALIDFQWADFLHGKELDNRV